MTDRTADSDSTESLEDVIEIRPLPRRNIVELQDIESEAEQLAFREFNEPDLMQGTGVFRRTGRLSQHRKSQDLPVTTPRLHQDPSQTIQFPSVIPLNVGGVKYVTRLSTLSKYPDSMLAALFSGRHTVDKDQKRALKLVVVISETCHKTTETEYSCKYTTCQTGNVECVDILGVHLCTCMLENVHGALNLPACTLKSDCKNMTAFVATCSNELSQHCVDGACRCFGIGHNHGHGHGNNQN
ncbi:uncharacterized protein LOC132564004 [Ylistrum balloti]|uniref:uncharacterized protein LOC132564004 n=1 Tax=Ylistrum balloti TaxID=509963 RepID=UPI002905B0DA|nr:uncharacterized protein LOC132564004 [Ylistrum balloti]